MPKRLILLVALQSSVLLAAGLHAAAAPIETAIPEIFSVNLPDSDIHPYKLHPKVDIPIITAAAAIDFFNFAGISKKDGTPEDEVVKLKISEINWLDRWAVHPYNKHIDKISYIPFYVAMPLPLAAFGIDNRMRKDFWQLTFLYGQAITLTGVLYTSAVHYIHRKRPLVYESASPMNERVTSNATNSFFAGHVALVGTSAFFIARTWADYHPESNKKWIFYTGASAITAITAYWRNKAGEHFPTDIAVGTTVGVLSGLLTPALHKTKIIKNQRLSVLPFSQYGSQGLAILYKL